MLVKTLMAHWPKLDHMRWDSRLTYGISDRSIHGVRRELEAFL